MKLVSVTKDEFEKLNPRYRGYKITKLLSLLTEFINSDVDIMEIADWKNDYANLNSARTTICNATKRFAVPVDVCQRKSRLFLLKRQ